METAANPSLLRSLAIEKRVIGALLMREILTRYGRKNIGFLWLFAEPMIFTLLITGLWTAMRSFHGSSIPIVAFGITGYSSVLLWRNMPARCIKAIEPNSALLYHRHVRPLDIYLSRVLLEAAGATISFMLLSLTLMFCGFVDPPEDVLTVIGGWLLMGWFGIGLGILIGAASESVVMIEKVWTPISYISFPLSGVAFLVDAMPTEARDLVLLIPMTHGIEMIRDGYFGSAFRAHYSVPYLLCWCMGLTLLGLAQVRSMQRDISPQ